MMLILLLSLFTTQAGAEQAPPLCSRQGFYFLGGYNKGKSNQQQRGIISSRWSPSSDPHFSSVYLSCSGKASQVCKKSLGRLGITVKSHKTQYSPLVLEASEKNMVSFRAKKLNFMTFFPPRVREGSQVVLYVGTATKALCQHAIEIIP